MSDSPELVDALERAADAQDALQRGDARGAHDAACEAIAVFRVGSAR